MPRAALLNVTGTPAIADRFGDVLTGDGAVDRAKLGPLVFGDASARGDLEAIVHPAVYRAIAAGLRGFELIGGSPLVVVDIPLLYETGHASDFAKVIATACPLEMQRARLLARGLSPVAMEQRLAAQLSGAEKAKRADFVIRTDGSFEQTDSQIDRVLETLLRTATE